MRGLLLSGAPTSGLWYYSILRAIIIGPAISGNPILRRYLCLVLQVLRGVKNVSSAQEIQNKLQRVHGQSVRATPENASYCVRKVVHL